LKEVYAWFFYKLKAIGALSSQEIQDELQFMNPDQNKLQKGMRAIIK
jgi:hypothetical protein